MDAPPELMLYMHSFAGGGAERVMVQLANHWAGTGRRVTLAVNLDQGPLAAELAPGVGREALGRKRGLLAAPALAALLRRTRPAALVSAMAEQNVTACLARRLARFPGPLLTVEHNFMSAALAGLGARGRLIAALMRWTYPMADAVAAVSAEAARDLETLARLPANGVRVLYNPIWPMEPDPARAAEAVHPWLAGPAPVLLAVGRLVAQKNHANLLEAFAIARQRRDLRLILLGEGPLLADLEARAATLGIAGDVAFAGFRRDVADFLARASLFVLSSDREGLPLSLMEALRLGTPVVATDCRSGPRELLEDGRHGALVPVRDPGALAEAILATLAAPPDPERLRARAADFATPTVAAAYEAALRGG